MTNSTLRKLVIIVSSVAAPAGGVGIDTAYARGGGGFGGGHMGGSFGGANRLPLSGERQAPLELPYFDELDFDWKTLLLLCNLRIPALRGVAT
jgi:hypothetical protein